MINDYFFFRIDPFSLSRQDYYNSLTQCPNPDYEPGFFEGIFGARKRKVDFVFTNDIVMLRYACVSKI